MKWLRAIVYRCPDCKKLKWFDPEYKGTLCFPCFFMFAKKLEREGELKMAEWRRGFNKVLKEDGLEAAAKWDRDQYEKEREE